MDLKLLLHVYKMDYILSVVDSVPTKTHWNTKAFSTGKTSLKIMQCRNLHSNITVTTNGDSENHLPTTLDVESTFTKKRTAAITSIGTNARF